MTFQRHLVQFLNRILVPLNLKLDSQTLAKREVERLHKATERKVFDTPIYPLPPKFQNHQGQLIFQALPKYQEAFDRLRTTATNQVGYQFENGFYTSPDTEILYTLVRELAPKQILEIGCGNSTRITRQAIRDGNLSTQLTCLDPYPRRDVAEFADTLHLKPVEDSPVLEILATLEPGDILFIDTSHEVRPANDCAYIYSILVPNIPAGVIVHIHDIFLPYEYPEHFSKGEAALWGEQYLVSVMLQNEAAWDVIWPGHYLQKTMPDFKQHFPHHTNGLAQSLWLRKC
jgi:predicted O-methyltransferase YrrM